MVDLLQPRHRTIFAVDVEAFASRTNPARAELRASMYALLARAFAEAGVDSSLIDLAGHRDGAIFLVEAKVPKNRLLERVPQALVAALAEHNIGRSDPMRLRVAIHAGEVVQDQHGYVGDAIDIATRLLASPTFLAYHQLTLHDLVVAVTDPIHRGVVEQTSTGGNYRRVIVESLGSRLPAWFRSFGGGGSPPREPPPRGPSVEHDDLHHRSILILDIEDSSSRPDDIKRAHRHQLRTMLSGAIEAAGISPDQYERCDTGDGLRVLFAPDVPKNRLIDPLVFSLVRQLEIYNRTVPRPARMRLRAVLDAGELRRDSDDYFGSPLNEACWLMDSDALRTCLRDASAPLALMVSDEIYDGVVRHGYGLIKADEYTPHAIKLKSRDVTAWLWTPSAL